MANVGEDCVNSKCFNECGHYLEDSDDTKPTGDFCDVCKKHLCSECYKQHKRAPSEIHHLTLLTPVKNQSIPLTDNATVAPSEERRGSIPNNVGIYVKSGLCEQSTYSNRPCCITGSAILGDNKMVVCDYSHCMLKYIDLEDGTIVSEFALDNHPWSVCRHGDTEVAVTLSYAQMIVFVQLEPVSQNSLSPVPAIVRVVEVGAECCGVACLRDEKLVVTLADKNIVAIIDYKGNVLKSLPYEDNGQCMFASPQYVTVNTDQTSIYVSNFHTNTVVCMTLEGELNFIYKDDELKGPSQITLGHDGMLYICAHYSQNIHKVTAAGEKVQVKDTKAQGDEETVLDGIDRPWSVSYHQQTGKLYVGLLGNCIKRYRF